VSGVSAKGSGRRSPRSLARTTSIPYSVECAFKALILEKTPKADRPALLERLTHGAVYHRPTQKPEESDVYSQYLRAVFDMGDWSLSRASSPKSASMSLKGRSPTYAQRTRPPRSTMNVPCKGSPSPLSAPASGFQAP
jgi:hypothetical protein